MAQPSSLIYEIEITVFHDIPSFLQSLWEAISCNKNDQKGGKGGGGNVLLRGERMGGNRLVIPQVSQNLMNA